MGWASCLESDREKADDRAFMAATCRSAVWPTAPIIVSDAPGTSVRLIMPLAPLAVPTFSELQGNAISVAQRRQQARDVHVLCFAELKPNRRPESHGRA